MTRHFMRDTPLYQMEQMMMTPPYFKPRGHGLRRSGFRYQAKDVDCEYCMNYSRRNLCPLDQCICLEERIETGALSLEELLRDCLNSKPKMSLWRRLAQLLYQQSLQFFRTDEHRRRWMHWRTRYHRLSQRNQAALFLLTAYDDIWRRVIWKVEDNGFDFDSVRLAGIQPELYSVYQAAKAISIGSQNITIADLASRELVTDEAFQLIICALLLAKYGISIATMIDLAYSTDCCHVVNATTDEQLGRFYAENDFIPALEKVPDSIFEYLDFEMLGRKARFEEGGVFASNGYVTQHTELKQVYETLDLMPSAPSYAIRLLAGSSLMDSDGLPEKQVYLNLPATQEALDHVLEVCEAPSWREMLFWTEDGAVPDLLENMDCDDIQELNELAKHLKCRENSSELSKLKAVILATDCHDVGTAIQISENLDDYLFEPDQRNPEEVASEELRLIVDEQSLSILKKHVSLYNYGLDVMAANHAVLTPYPGTAQNWSMSTVSRIWNRPCSCEKPPHRPVFAATEVMK